MLTLQGISYALHNKELLFDNIGFSVNHRDKTALIGNNGAGKSTLLKIIAKELQPASGQLKIDSEPYYVPQIFGQYNQMTIAQAMRIEDKLSALEEILNGNAREDNFSLLNDDWTFEDRCHQALDYWGLTGFKLRQKLETLSGGEKTKVFLAGILVHQPELILLDEPSNHLDKMGRQLLYEFIQSTKSTLIVVSHDGKLLNLLNKVYELSKGGVTTYGGDYDFYVEQKRIENNALNQDIQNKEKTLRQAKDNERETLERQHKLDSRAKKKQEKAGVARIMLNTLRNRAENSTSKIKGVHAEKIIGISDELRTLRAALPDVDKMKFSFDHSALHKGKILLNAVNINFGYNAQTLWKENLVFQFTSGERIALKGVNGSGKTTLIKLILGYSEPQTGTIHRTQSKSVYIDQDYSLINNGLSVYEQAQRYNKSALQEHEIKIRLNRFLFTMEDWEKPCSALSGGERMRLVLCCLTIDRESPDIIVLDEPTNNLDIQNIEILAAALNEYQGTLIVISHDETFLEEVNIGRTLQL
jgi:ATPase subunit of ABC transporter with duplicated ATPase domains